MEECLFCKIAKKEIPSELISEDDKFVAIKDLYPKAPMHILLIPKKHISSIDGVDISEKELMGDLLLFAQKVARKMNLVEPGYKLVFNVGKGGGQSIFHLHLHLLSGWRSEKERDIPGMP